MVLVVFGRLEVMVDLSSSIRVHRMELVRVKIGVVVGDFVKVYVYEVLVLLQLSMRGLRLRVLIILYELGQFPVRK